MELMGRGVNSLEQQLQHSTDSEDDDDDDADDADGPGRWPGASDAEGEGSSRAFSSRRAAVIGVNGTTFADDIDDDDDDDGGGAAELCGWIAATGAEAPAEVESGAGAGATAMSLGCDSDGGGLAES
jgi:hypothetical protein